MFIEVTAIERCPDGDVKERPKLVNTDYVVGIWDDSETRIVVTSDKSVLRVKNSYAELRFMLGIPLLIPREGADHEQDV